MPRRGGSFGGNSRSSSPNRNTSTAQAPVRKPTPPAPQPQVQSHPPVQTQQQGGFLSGMAGTFVTGMALGAGSEVAHQTVRGLMGGSSSHQQAAAPQQNVQPMTENQQQQTKPQSCEYENSKFVQCLKDYSDIGMCQSYADLFKECQKKYGI